MNTETYRFKVGSFKCIAVSDGIIAYPEHIFFANAPKERLEQVLHKHNIQPGEITVPYTCLVIKTGRHQVLVDTGAGELAPSTGHLLQNLRSEGIEPGDIDTVILTHGHPDHIGGNIDSEGKPAFPSARYVMWKDEWDFWASEPSLAQLKVEEEMKQVLRTFAHKNLSPLQAQLQLIDRESEIVPGILAVAAPGHTPGHMTLAISSGREHLWHISDAALYPIHLEQPDWYPVFDLVPEQAMATKRQLLERVAAEKAMVIASHFPFPSLGHVIQKGDGWQWQPIEATG